MKLTSNIIKRLSEFFDSYREKAEFLKDLSRKSRGADEIILLVCCYIDQLGGCLFPKAGSSKRSFELMLLNHSGESEEFSLISVADLAADILWTAESASYTIPKPGRVQLPSDDLKPLIKFLDETGVALTEKSFRKLLISLYESLKSNFRIHPYQTARKNSYAHEETAIHSIITCPELKRIGEELTNDHVKKLIREYTYTSILYREYRCKAVHEAAGIYVVPKKFWKLKRPYFVEITHSLLKYPVFGLEFPSSFLIECLETCIECAEKAIIGKGLLPLPIWGALCDLEDIEFMDVEGIEEAKPLRLRIE